MQKRLKTRPSDSHSGKKKDKAKSQTKVRGKKRRMPIDELSLVPRLPTPLTSFSAAKVRSSPSKKDVVQDILSFNSYD